MSCSRRTWAYVKQIANEFARYVALMPPVVNVHGVARLAVSAVVIGSCVAFAAPAAQATTPWKSCSKTQGATAARKAGLSRALDNDRSLRRVFSGVKLSSVYKRPGTSLCGDFDDDGHTDRALLYQCCTVSSPAPWVVLRRQGSAWRIAYRRLHDATFKVEGDRTRLITTEPKYASSDGLCCPSHLRIGTLRWTGSSFKRSFRIEDAQPT